MAAGCTDGVEQLEEEDGVPGRALRDLLHVVWRQRPIVGREVDDLGHHGLGQREQGERQRAEAFSSSVGAHVLAGSECVTSST